MFDIFKKLDVYKKSISSMPPIEYIMVGLGNPGIKYEYTRHNAGFMAIDYILDNIEHDNSIMRFNAVCNRGIIDSHGILFMKPQTFMNNSGESVAPAMRFYKIPCEKVILLFDDISLPPGKIRIRRKGSSGGHNGIKSIIGHTGNSEFPRIKIGIGQKPYPNMELADWVLSKFSNEDKDLIYDAIKNCYEAIPSILKGNFEEAMNKFN